MKSAIITGPTGAVGVSLINELVSQGWNVLAVVRPNSNRISAVPVHPNVEIAECDLRDLKNLNLKGKKYDAFFHFGWVGTYGAQRQDIPLQNSNIEYTLDAVNAAHRAGCEVFVGAGSQSEFGHISGVLHPDLFCNPDNGYGAAKLSACHMSRVLCQQLGIRTSGAEL